MRTQMAPPIGVFLAPLMLLLLLDVAPFQEPVVLLPVSRSFAGPDHSCGFKDGVMLSLTADRRLFMNSVPVDLDAVPRASGVVLMADARLSYGDVAPILRKLRGQGASVCIATAALLPR
ncbi:MAG TPA: hypothetical protein VFA20_13605 [Myxococcaceae bacterium]|nr:hypothetical protein [Myxococcaceae bacterium]